MACSAGGVLPVSNATRIPNGSSKAAQSAIVLFGQDLGRGHQRCLRHRLERQ
jgi:hypothetical protein